MALKISRYIGIAIKGERKDDPNTFSWGVVMAFSWCMALGNHLCIEIDDEIWKRFPGHCPYCSNSPCKCKERAANREVVSLSDTPRRPLTVEAFRIMFGEIYPNNTLDSSIKHLAEEVAELLEALQAFEARHQKEDFEDVVTEYVDVLANIFAVMNCCRTSITFDLVSTYYNTFKDGCPKCTRFSCICGFTTATGPQSTPKK